LEQSADEPLFVRVVELALSGRLAVTGATCLTGSANSLHDRFHVAMTPVGVTLAAAIALAARTPRSLLGRDDPDDWTVVRS